MSRILIFIYSLIVLLIIIGSLVIYFLNKNSAVINQNNSIQSGKPTPIVLGEEDGGGFFTKLTLISAQKNGDKVLAKISSPSAPSIIYNVTLFDKEIYPYLFIDLPPKYGTLQVDSTTLRDTEAALTEINKYKGDTMQALVPLKGPPDDKATLSCNKKFSEALKQKKEFFDCLPLIIQLSANAQYF